MSYQPPAPTPGNDSTPALFRHAVEMARAVGMLFQGKSNNVMTFTCTAGAGSTVLTDPRLTIGGFMGLDATTANAAAELAAGTIYPSVRNNGVWTITHANAGTTDRTFRLVVVG